MPITSWIRDLFGIQKDMYETKKTRLEIEKIEDEKREKLITPATLDDVKEYDPKYRKIRTRLKEWDSLQYVNVIKIILMILLVVQMIVFLLAQLIRFIQR
ncbi:MAG TPA: hypothetical protein VJ866_04395 [Pyrinomonadaceae bacterium]|nr:hypothetical protein [Pyrinomonadaceae bacterium]